MFIDKYEKLLTLIANILILVGGLNLGLMGLFKLDLISTILGGVLGRLIFIVIGVGAGYLIYLKYFKKESKPAA